MRWIVGLDLRPRSDGALRFAAWLARTAPGADSFALVHVLEEEHLRAVLRVHHLDEVTAAARDRAVRELARVEGAAGLGTPEIVRGITADEALAEALARHGADALVVGRIAGREEPRVIRLGRVARRLLRHLPAPVVVVPPDEDPAARAGPVVALTSLTDDAAEACRFAAAFAERVARPLFVAHVVPFVDLPFLPGPTLDDLASQGRRAGEAALAAWIAAHGLLPAQSVVLQGGILEQAEELARERDALLVVAGSTRRSGLERLASPSIGAELAAIAPVPVAVVPPRA
jgi:nucleotide-binding universal stress UspA family protein